MVNITGAPYYDNTESEYAKGYRRVLPKGGRNLQIQELQAMQGFAQKGIERLGNVFLQDGAIIDGCDVIVSTNPPVGERISIRVTAGKVWARGEVWDVPELTDTPVGNVGDDPSDLDDITVDLVLNESIVTYNDDSDLESPVLGRSNYGRAGADRLQVIPTFELNNPGGYTVYRLVEGVVVNKDTTTVFSKLEPVLARRTYDAHGNFSVTGLEVSYKGEDEDAFEEQARVKPSPSISHTATATITPGVASHPYGPAYTNRITINSHPNTPDMGFEDIGRRFVITSSTEFDEGSYTITDVISVNEIEVDGQFSGSQDTAVEWEIKEQPENLSFFVDAGKAYVNGFEVVIPQTVELSIPKATDSKVKSNEPQTVTFRRYEYSFNSQPFKEFLTVGGEGLTCQVYYGIGFSGDVAAAAGHSGFGSTTPQVTRGGASSDSLTAFIPGNGSLVEVWSVMAPAATWEWHLDPADGDYPGVVTAGTVYTPQVLPGSPSGTGWYVDGDSIVWGTGGVLGVDYPATGANYKVIANITKTLVEGKDFRVKSTAQPVLYPFPGGTTPTTTSDALFFPQETFDLSSDQTLTVVVDGVEVAVDFDDAKTAGVFAEALTVVTLRHVADAINWAANTAGIPGIASVQIDKYDTSVEQGWVILRSPTTGSTASLEITSGNIALGFPAGATGISAYVGSDDPRDVISLGGFRTASLLDISDGLSVDYEYGLYRKDLVAIKETSEFFVASGESDTEDLAVAREGFINMLSLGMIELSPLSTDNNVVNYETRRTTMPDLKRMADRLDNVEYLLAVLELNKEGQGSENPASVTGLFTDGFVGFSKIDQTYSADGVSFDAAVDLVEKELRLPFEEEQLDLVASINATSSTADCATGSSVALIPTASEATPIFQDKASTEFELNSFSTYQRKPRIFLSPFFDSLYRINQSDQKPVVQGKEIDSRHIVSLVAPRASHSRTEKENSNLSLKSGSDVTQNARPATGNLDREASYDLIRRSKLFLRPRTITIRGKGFAPNEERIQVKFDGVPVTLTFTAGNVGTNSSTYTGTHAGKVQAKSDGTFIASFVIPTALRKFQRRLFHNVTAQGEVSLQAITVYRTWMWRFFQPVVGRRSDYKTSFLPISPAEDKYSPVAQTFFVEADRVLRGVTLYFKSVNANSTLKVQVRDIINDLPGETVLGETVVSTQAAALTSQVSSDGSVGIRFNFNDPVLLTANENYCLVVSTPDTGSQIWLGQVGSFDLATGQPISKPERGFGDLYISRNNTDWRSDENSFLKAVFHTLNFSTSTQYQLVINAVSPSSSFNSFILTAEALEMSDSIIVWQYSVDSGSVWNPITPFEVTNIDASSPVSSIQFRALISTTNPLSSVLLLKDSIDISVRNFDLSGNYISNLVSFPAANEYDEIRMSYKVLLGSGGSVVPYFGYVDDDNTLQWVALSADPNKPSIPLSDGFTQLFYLGSIPLTAPDMTLPASITGTVAAATYDVSNATGDDTLAFDIVGYDGGVTTDSVSIDFDPGVTTPATATRQSIVNYINSAAGAVDARYNAIASVDSDGYIVLTHPETGGWQRNSITITTGNTSLGFTAVTDYGGTITGEAQAGSSPGAGTYYYAFVGVLGNGQTQDTIEDLDTIEVAVTGAEKAVFAFDVGGTTLDPKTEQLLVFRAEGTPSPTIGTSSLDNWKLLTTLTLSAPGVAPAGGFEDDGSYDLDATDTIRPPTLSESAKCRFTTFRARLAIASSVAGNSPKVRDLACIFGRPA